MLLCAVHAVCCLRRGEIAVLTNVGILTEVRHNSILSIRALMCQCATHALHSAGLYRPMRYRMPSVALMGRLVNGLSVGAGMSRWVMCAHLPWLQLLST